MFWSKKEKEEQTAIDWHRLESLEQIETIKTESFERPVLIYKHSTRCGISSMVLDRMERAWTKDLENLKVYYLDLIAYREVSNEVANTFEVYHESPQVILVQNGKATFDTSHTMISPAAIERMI